MSPFLWFEDQNYFSEFVQGVHQILQRSAHVLSLFSLNLYKYVFIDFISQTVEVI